jgi:hypothetical protein
MIWSTWRQHRLEAYAAAAVLAGTAVMVVVATGQNALENAEVFLQLPLIFALAALPAAVGVFVGAALLSRDFEHGTHRLLWTQGTPRARWLVAKLALVFTALLAAGAVLATLTGVVVSDPQVVAANVGSVDPWNWFDMAGPAFAAYVVFALALGVALGAVVRRTYPAMALTLVVYIAVRVLVATLLRPRYMTPARVQLESFMAVPNPPGGDPLWVDFVYRTTAGQNLTIDQALQRVSGAGGESLAAHGLVGWAYYQPGDRFWTFQGIEAALFCALAALLVGFTLYWVTRRLA